MAEETVHSAAESLTISMPVLNEVETLRPALDRFVKTDLGLLPDVVVNDDGFTDGTTGGCFRRWWGGRPRLYTGPTGCRRC